MSTTNDAQGIQDVRTTSMSQAQLYWDDQDDECAGWTLRWYDAKHGQLTRDVDGDEDASVRDLAEGVERALEHVADGLLGVSGIVRVYRGDVHRGHVEIRDGEVVSWRAS